MSSIAALKAYLPAPGSRAHTLATRINSLLALFRLLVLLKALLYAYRHVRARGLRGTGREIYNAIKNQIVALLLRLPSSQAKIKSELAEVHRTIRAKLTPTTYPDGTTITRVRTLGDKGKSKAWLDEEWANLKMLDKGDVEDGRVSGAVYHGGEELYEVINGAMSAFVSSNPLHPDVFPGVRKMESEVVSMVLDLFHGSKGAGTTTSGGTESILMSVKTHRDWARAVKGITAPEMIIPSSAHAAFYKASQYFGIKLHVIPVNETTREADIKRMRRAINPNTIMLVGSAPNYPDGAIDNIPALASLAVRYRLGLHVDCCLGSFLMPFLASAGLDAGIPKFDFRVKGVTAISCDTHKYAFCPKGSSVIMYHSPELRRYQYYVQTTWSGGLYASPSMAGSRPGSVLAGAWAVMNYMGKEGYTDSCRLIVSAAREFASKLRLRFPNDLYVLGDPKVCVVAFGSKTLNVYGIGDAMSKKGWHLSACSDPPALHMAFTRLTAASVDKLLDDLEEVVIQIKKDPPKDGDMVALYGLGQTAVGPTVVSKVAEIFLDTLYE